MRRETWASSSARPASSSFLRDLRRETYETSIFFLPARPAPLHSQLLPAIVCLQVRLVSRTLGVACEAHGSLYLLKMIKKRPISCLLFFKIRREVTTCALHVDPADMVVSTTLGNHKSLCVSLAERLLQRGLFSSSQQVIRRLIRNSVSVSYAIFVADVAVGHGLDLDLGNYDALIRKLVTLGEPQLAESLYLNRIIARGINPDPSILNSMVICSCKLGKVEEARNHFDRLLSLNCVPYKEACDSILQVFCAQERFLNAFDCFLRALDAGAQLSFWSYSILIDGLCHRGHLDEALQVFDILQNCHSSLPTVHLYKSLFYGLCKSGRVVEAELIFEEMESQGMYVDRAMYTFLVHEYCRNRKMKMAMRVFLRMLKKGCEPDRYICNTLIYGFMKLNLFDKGWVICSKMMEWRIKPDVVTYQIMISQYCREKKIDYALVLLDKMIDSNLTPNVQCYTVLISTLYKQKMIEKAYDLYKCMMQRGVIPDHVLFFILMKIFPEECEFQLALPILQALAKNGCGLDSSIMQASSSHSPTHDLEQEIELLLGIIVRKNLNLANVAYGIFISALCEKGQIDKALVCLGKMFDLGCRPLRSSYNSVIKCLSHRGLFDYANFVIELMEGCGLVPDQATYLIIINELCKRGNMISVDGILGQMEDRGMKPSVAIYNSIIGCLCKERRIFAAEDMFKRMLQSGVDPDEAVYITMINGYSMSGRALEACELLDKMMENSIKPSSRSYTALIGGLIKKHMIDKGCVYLGRMLEDGMLPNTVLYTSLIKHFFKDGDFEFAFKLFDLTHKNQIECDLIMWIVLASGIFRYISGTKNRSQIIRRQSEREKEMLLHLLHQNPLLPIETSKRVLPNSMKLIQKIKDVPFMPNLYLYNCIITWFCWEGKIRDAYDHFQLMQNEGVCPNQVTYTILLDGHIQSDDIDSAVRLFNKMNVDGCVPDRIAYNTLLKGFIRAGRLIDAVSLVYAMHKRGLYPNRASYAKLLYCFRSCGLSVFAFRVFEEMVALNYKPPRNDCYWLLYNLCENNRLIEAHLVLDMTRQRGRTLYNGEKMLLMSA